ncbi:hypothetical protein [Pontibacter lucknowensis]|uniref:Uncharacterized protein n=1 Tax=Pontibacter lucknowensis TaxID=1077936 RepID=A0A1N6THU8_9BACT|nr:hypothetical protein [Pontibacter lucknowensis]SIQ52817.1 hypothetical protein SAMN05421545_0337 [Pontibacter lucknowensis]
MEAMKDRISLRDFLTLVEVGLLDRLEILDYIEEVTNNHQPHRLQILLDEIDIHISIRRDELECEYHDRIIAALDQCSLQGKVPPHKIITLPGDEPKKVLDKDKLLNGAISIALYPLYQLKREIESIRFKHTINTIMRLIKQHNAPQQEQTPQAAALQQTSALQGLAPSSIAEFDFYYHLTEEGKQIYPIIKELYSKVRFKKEYAIMLVVLKELGYLMNKHFTNKEQLTSALKTTFGNIGSRQNLFNYIGIYGEAPGPDEREELKRHKQRLLDAINKTSP